MEWMQCQYMESHLCPACTTTRSSLPTGIDVSRITTSEFDVCEKQFCSNGSHSTLEGISRETYSLVGLAALTEVLGSCCSLYSPPAIADQISELIFHCQLLIMCRHCGSKLCC